jgi:uncharacterized repeat protein (TIGR02543 family)
MKKLLIIILPVILLLAALSACGPYEITYTFDYNYEGAPDPLVITFTNTERPDLPDEPEREGYVFDGWAFDSGEAFNEDDVSYVSLTLKAQWLTERIVTFVINSETVTAPEAQKIGDGRKASEPDEISTADAQVVGWYTDEALTALYDFDMSVNSNMTLYAKWGDKITVTFNLNYDGAPASFTIEYVEGMPIELPDEPTRENYTFVNWLLNADKYATPYTEFDEDYELTDDITVYAQWVQTGGF